jgi:transcriptional regulator with XRE-family HTH domain
MHDHLPARLKSARKSAGMTQRELADATGLSQSYLAQIEQGDKMPSLETLQKIATSLGRDVAWLLGQGIGKGVRNYKPTKMQGPIRDLLADYQTPPGLRDLASDLALVASLQITPDEWRALASIDLPDEATKDGYVNLLFTVRSIIGR